MKKKNYLPISTTHNEEMETITTVNFISSTNGFTKAGFLTMLFLMAAASTFAQNRAEKTKNEIAVLQTIKGMVLSAEDSTALDGANIILKGTGVGTIADKQGRFIFPQQLKEGDILLVSFVGTQTQEYIVPAQADASLVIKMKMGFDLTGDPVMSEVYAKPTRKHK